MKSTKGAKIYFSLLALCYLEIVLWTACLLFTANGAGLPAEAAAGHTYLQRETCNLKAFTGTEQPSLSGFDELVLSISEEHHQLEHLSLQLLFNQWSTIAASLLQQLHAPALGPFPVVQGLPAPFTGIKAID